MEVEDKEMEIRHLIHDWDTKFTAQFDSLLKGEAVEIHKLGPQKPNLNAYAERFIQSLQTECLDHFVVLGERHLNHIVTHYIDHYNDERPHQSLANSTPRGRSPTEGQIVCDKRLGGLLKSYRRAA